MPTPRFAVVARVGVGIGLFLLLFGELLPSSTFLAARDAFHIFLPALQFWSEEVHQGRFPTWWPYDGIGASMVGGAEGIVASPLQVLGWFLAPAQALKWQVLLGYVIAAVGAARLARRAGAGEPGQWFAGIAFGACGYLLSVGDNLCYQQTPAFLPWTLLAADYAARTPLLRGGVVLGLAWAVAFWAGDLQGAAIQVVIAGAVVVALAPRRAAPVLVISLALLACWCAPFIGAILGVAKSDGRTGLGFSLEEGSTWSLHPFRLLEIVLGPPYALADYYVGLAPFIEKTGGRGSYQFAASVAVGPLAVASASLGLARRALSKSTLVLLVLSSVLLLLALGPWGGLHSLFVRFLPLWSAFRYPQKLVVYSSLALAVAGGVGLDSWAQAGRATWAILLGGIVGATSLAALGSPETLAAVLSWPVTPHDVPVLETVSSAFRLRAEAAVAVLAFLALAHRYQPRWAPVVAAGLGILQTLWFAADVIPPADTALLEHRPALLQSLLAHGGEHARLCNGPDPFFDPALAMATPETRSIHIDLETLGAGQADRFGLGNLLSYTPSKSMLLESSCGSAPRCGSPCARRMAASWGIIPAQEAAAGLIPGLSEIDRIASPGAVLVHDERARALVSVPGVHFVSSAEEVRRGVQAPSDGIPLAWMIAAHPDLPAQPDALTFQRPRPDRIEIDAHLAANNMVIVAEQGTPGWHASVDGQSVSIHRADLALMAIPVPAGEHRVVLGYLPPGWPWAWALYVGAWGLAAVVGGRKRPSQGQTVIVPGTS